MGSGTGHAQHTATPAVPVRTLRRSRSSGSLSACRPEPSLLPSRTHRSEGRAFSSAFKTKPHKNIRRQGVGGGLWAVKGAPREKSRRVYRLTVEARVRAGPGSATQPRERARVRPPASGEPPGGRPRPLACPPYTPLWGRVSPVSPGLPSWPRSGVPMTKTEPARRGARCAPEPGRGLRGADARCGHAAVTASQGPSRLLSFRLHSLVIPTVLSPGRPEGPARRSSLPHVQVGHAWARAPSLPALAGQGASEPISAHASETQEGKAHEVPAQGAPCARMRRLGHSSPRQHGGGLGCHCWSRTFLRPVRSVFPFTVGLILQRSRRLTRSGGISVRGEIEVRAGRQEAASMWLLLGHWDKEGP